MSIEIKKDIYHVRIAIAKPVGTIDYTKPYGQINVPIEFRYAAAKYNSHNARRNGHASIYNIRYTEEYIEFDYKIVPLHMTRISNIIGGSISKWLYEDGWDALTTCGGTLFKVVSSEKIFDGLSEQKII